MDSSTQVLVYLNTTSTVLELVLAISLSAVLVLILNRQSTWTWQVLSQILFMLSLNIWLYLKKWKKDRVFTVMFFFLTNDMKHKWCKKITAMKMTVYLLLFCTQHHDMNHK